MSEINKALQEILENDPLGLLNVKPKTSSVLSADERLIASFEEINSFIEKNDREPIVGNDISERKLASRLKALRENPEKAASLQGFDRLSLLTDAIGRSLSSIDTIEGLMEHDALGLLEESSDPEDIFILKNVPAAPKPPDFIAKRKPCKEFEQFEPLFKENHAALAARTKVTRPFYSEKQIAPSEFFIVDGIMVYVANRGRWEKKNFGNKNARLYCVFENGTESNMLLRSLAAALWKDKSSRQIINADQYELFKEQPTVIKGDEPTGYIYIIKSLSEDSQIKSIKDLYKVGFSKQSVESRIKDASQDPTFLMADVKLIAEYQTYNLNTQKLELLLHKFFADSCLNIDIFDNAGKRHSPREWFVAPWHVIQQAIHFVNTEEIVQFKYDADTQTIVRRKNSKNS